MNRTVFIAALFLIGGVVVAQEKDDFDWTDDPDREDTFVWMGGMDLPELPAIPELPMFAEMFTDMGGEYDVDVELPAGMGDVEGVELTKDQRDKMHQIRSQTKKANISLAADMKIKRIELKELMRTDNPSKDKVAAKVKEIEALRAQIQVNKLHSRIDLRNVLTKEQRDKLDEMRSKMPMQMHWKGLPGMHGKDGNHKMKRFMIEREKE